MDYLTSLQSWATGTITNYSANLFPPLPASLIQNYIFPNTAAAAKVNISADIEAFLSPGAGVYLPGSRGFAEGTDRWQTYLNPGFAVVVQVASEADVQKTVQYASGHAVPFLAVSGGHGTSGKIAQVQEGIGIGLRHLNHARVTADGQSATFGGGIIMKEVVNALDAVGKWTAGGACLCPGAVSILLGGGHGYLQGKYGLVSDNLISARVVLANGSLVTASLDSHPDLFWALQGAGHNFGIVTEYTIKIYDMPEKDEWAFESILFPGDQVERAFEVVNAVMEHQPAELTLYNTFVNNAEIDAENTILMIALVLQGTADELRQYSAPFHNLKPLTSQAGTATYKELFQIFGTDLDGSQCRHGRTIMLFPIGLRRYNPQAQQRVYEHYNRMLKQHPEFSGSSFLFEGWPTQGKYRVEESTSAVAYRHDALLLSPLIMYTPNPALDALAVQFGEDLRKIVLDGIAAEDGEEDQLHAYVNYAHGGETMQQIYGEEWRVEKLRRLKAMYDPSNAFGFSGPLV
ncbi:hypothetical protein BP5796_04489 [Coleophoma crateriformis]|uniref:FAD-binding PCMH-type domain-containing protein n=1 Tax=Coleophoma crateriformis TaxID=565419 RepID=A0A3D8SB40_9HELO|nr:hypothetical protein BP5796_04489 [Coleophoma crateriformis]